MNKEEFRRRLEAELETAATLVEQRLKRTVPREFRVELNGAGHWRDLLDVEYG